jgi:hypothetical protein
MSFSNLIITGCEILASGLLIYGFTKEDKMIQIEQKAIKKIKKAIYNLIVKLEG